MRLDWRYHCTTFVQPWVQHIPQRIAELIECQHERTGDLTDDLGGGAPALVKAEQKGGASKCPTFHIGRPTAKKYGEKSARYYVEKEQWCPRSDSNQHFREEPDFEGR
jgi:hypothetical protein